MKSPLLLVDFHDNGAAKRSRTTAQRLIFTGYFEACGFGLPANVPAAIGGNVSGSALLYVATPARYRASGMDRAHGPG
jgi:hypothetical protein